MSIGPLHGLQNRHLGPETCNSGVGIRQKRPPRTRSGRCTDPNTEKSYPPGIGTRIILPRSAGRQGTVRPARKPPSYPRGSHTRTDAPHGRQSSKIFNQPVPEIRRPALSPDSGCQWRLEPPPKSIRRPAGPGSRPRRIQTLSDSGLADPTEPAGHTLPGRFKAARRRGVSPGRLSLRRTRVAATIHHPAAQAAGGNRRSPERTEKSYPPGLKASICEAPGVRGRTPGALGRPNSPARIARTRGAHWPPLISLRSPAPHQSIRTPTPNTPTRNKPTRSSNPSKRCNWLLESRPEPGPFSVARTTTRSDTRPSLPRLQRVATRCEFGNFAQSAPSTNTPRTHASVRPRGGDEPAFHHRLTRGPRDRPAW